jgi:ribose transport system permease protein
MSYLRTLWQQYRDLIPIYGAMLIVLGLTAVLQSKNVFTLENITSLIVELTPYILAAMAQTLVMLLGGIDLSVGALISLSSTLVATHLNYGGANALVILGILAFTGILGALTGLFIDLFKLPAIVVTLATSFIWEGLAMRVLPTPGGEVPDSVALWLIGVYGPVPLMAVILLLCFVLWGYLRSTRVGLLIYAVGSNPKGARATGLSTRAAHAWTYGLAGVFAGLAGIVLSAQTSSGNAHIGDPLTLASIAAAVLGGISFFGGEGKMAGSVAGAIVLGMLVDLLFYAGFTSFYEYIAEGVILLLVVGFSFWRRSSSGRIPRLPGGAITTREGGIEAS